MTRNNRMKFRLQIPWISMNSMDFHGIPWRYFTRVRFKSDSQNGVGEMPF